MKRRDFLAGAGTLALAARPLFAAAQTAARSGVFPPSVRLHFPSVATETYLNSAALHPVGRLGEVSEVVDAVWYLENAQFVTGETLHVDGGQHAGHW